ncbi:MAG: arginine deiminase family protein [Ignavibacteriaceae bacterium]|jgi:dimethylargininase
MSILVNNSNFQNLMFKKAIVRKPCKNLINGLTNAGLGKPDYQLALKQHQRYIEALEKYGLDVIVLEADENYPDSTFVEDTALLTPHCAIVTNPGASSRKGEIIEMNSILKSQFSNIDYITAPGTLEAGDVMKVGKHFYIGISERTNQNGAYQLVNILKRYGYTSSTLNVGNTLHLKSGVSYLEKNNLLSIKNFIDKADFQELNIIPVDDDESYAANSLWINDKIMVPYGFPKTEEKIKNAGYTVIDIDVSEFRKLDGGLSCLSLRF